jgi:hypothetical protein
MYTIDYAAAASAAREIKVNVGTLQAFATERMTAEPTDPVGQEEILQLAREAHADGNTAACSALNTAVRRATDKAKGVSVKSETDAQGNKRSLATFSGPTKGRQGKGVPATREGRPMFDLDVLKEWIVDPSTPVEAIDDLIEKLEDVLEVASDRLEQIIDDQDDQPEPEEVAEAA